MNINIWGIIANFTWILGLSILFAVWSFAVYEARLAQQKVREKFEEFGYALALDLGMLVFIVGLTATENRWWARILWSIMGIGIIVDAGMRIKVRQAEPATNTDMDKEHENTQTVET